MNMNCNVAGVKRSVHPPAPRSAFSSPRTTCGTLRTALVRISTGLGGKVRRVRRAQVSMAGIGRRMEGRVRRWSSVGAVGVVLTNMLLVLPLLYRTRGGLFGGCKSVGNISSICVSGTVVRAGPGLFAGSICVKGISKRLGSIRMLSAVSGGMGGRVHGSLHSLIRSSECRLLVGRGKAISDSRFCVDHGKRGIGRLVVVMSNTTALGFICLRNSVALGSVRGVVVCRGAD